mgnify:FL=1
MAFSLDVKKELSQIKNLANKEEVNYELMGYFISNNISCVDKKIKYSTENEYNIDRFSKLLKNINFNNFDISVLGKSFIITFREKDFFDVLEKKNINQFNLDMFSYLRYIFEKINSEKNIELIKSFIRGGFLGSGSINNPENTYHMEIYIKNREVLEKLFDIVQKYNLNLKKSEQFLYIKDGEEISKFLAFIGANKSVLKFEEIRVQKYMNNKVNRLVNCKTANLNKVLNASIEQIDAINKLKKNGKFEKLDESLKEIANLRIDYPDLSLIELGQKLKSPLGKSGVNYRMKKIIQISKIYW